MNKSTMLIHLFFIIFYNQLSFAQEHIISVKPNCEQEDAIKKVFSKMVFKDTSNEVYVLHFRPNACPRCEAGIWLTASKLKEKEKNTILIIDTDNKEKSKTYLDEVIGLNKGDFTYILHDTKKIFRNFIDYRATFNLGYPFIYKIDKSQGKFYSISSFAGTHVSEDWIASIIKGTDYMQCIPCEPLDIIGKEIGNSFWTKETELEDSLKITAPSYIIANNDYIYFSDADKVLLFDTTAHLVQVYKPKYEEYFTVIDSNKALREKIKKDFIDNNFAKVIYLAADVNRSGNVKISASVPKIWYVDTNSFYMNNVVFIEKDRNSNDVKRTIFVSMGEVDTFSPSHHYYKPILDGSFYSFPVYKGWPAVGYELDEKDSANNPFLYSFYSNVPIMRLYKDYKPYMHIGALSNIYKEKQLGYFYADPFSISSKDRIYIADRTSGELQIIDTKNIVQKRNAYKIVQLFPEKIKELATFVPTPTDNSTKMKRLLSYEPILFQSFVWDMKSDKNGNLCVLIKDNKNSALVFRQYNSDGTTLISERRFTLNNTEVLLSGSIQMHNGKPYRIIGLEKIGGVYFIKSKNL